MAKKSFINQIFERGNFTRLKKILYFVQYLLAFLAIAFLLKLMDKIQFVKIDILYFLYFLIAILSMRFFSIVRLKSLINGILNVRLRNIITSQLLSISFGLVTPGKIGESYKIFVLGKTSKVKKKLALVFLFEKIMDSSMYIIFGAIFSLLTRKYILQSIALLVALAIATFFYLRLNNLFSLKVKRFFSLYNILISVFAFISFLSSFWLILIGAGVHISFYSASMIITLGSIVGIMSSLPGGIGGREITGTILLANIAGIDYTLAGNLALMHTFLNYLVTFSVTFIVVIIAKITEIVRQ